jgi:hypothetical protein
VLIAARMSLERPPVGVTLPPPPPLPPLLPLEVALAEAYALPPLPVDAAAAATAAAAGVPSGVPPPEHEPATLPAGEKGDSGDASGDAAAASMLPPAPHVSGSTGGDQ